MYRSEFYKLYFGFLFILFDFRINGFDILPNIIGYILFAMALNSLSSCSEYFSTAGIFTALMIILSIFTIYVKTGSTGGFDFVNGPFGYLSIIITVLSIIFTLLVIYNLFQGIEHMAIKYEKTNLSQEAKDKWKMYITFQIAMLIYFVLAFMGIPFMLFFLIMFFASIVVMVLMMSFIRKCAEQF